ARGLLRRQQARIGKALIVPGIAVGRTKAFGGVIVGAGALGAGAFPPHAGTDLSRQPAEIEVLGAAEDIAIDAERVLLGIAGNIVLERDAAHNGAVALRDPCRDIRRRLLDRGRAQRLVAIVIGIKRVVDGKTIAKITLQASII